MKRLPMLIPLLVILGCFATADARGSDWPQFRYDAGRTAASPDGLPEKLDLAWTRQLLAPRPAFPNEVRLRFDASYEPVVLGKTLFVPSMVTDSVTAYDTETGRERWSFLADAPVRFAPAVCRDKVYFVADDGFLYCVDAADGSLAWKFRGLPEDVADRKILGHRRLISLWPARGGPVVADGVVYFAAGLWPSYGVFVHALDAESGAVVWSNTDSHKIPEANMDHGIAQYAGLAPQGYLAIVGDKLVVPCGAQLPALLDAKTGKLDDYCTGWGGRTGLPKGTWFVAGRGSYLSHSGDFYDITQSNDERFRDSRGTDYKGKLYTGRLTRLRIDPANQKSLGFFRRPVLAPEVMYETDREGITAYDLTTVDVKERAKTAVPSYRREDKYPDQKIATLEPLWKLASKARVHIKAGSSLYIGGTGFVEAINVNSQGNTPKVAWHAAIEGSPHRMLAADGKLFVVTLEGRVYAFSGTKRERAAGAVVEHAVASPPAVPKNPWTEKVAKLLETTKITDGYALVLGLDTGSLVEELAAQSDLHVIAIDRDADRVAALRKRLHDAGRYGTRASVQIGDPLAYPFPPYLANLVVSEDMDALIDGAKDTRVLVESLVHPLRPYGGTVCLGAGSKLDADSIEALLASDRLRGVELLKKQGRMLLTRSGPLPGSADWSHHTANAANTGASEDGFLKAPLSLLWFDASHRWQRKPGSTAVRVSGGRVLIKADQIHAIDAYTGRVLWQATLPFPNHPSNQMVAMDDAIYVTGGATCVVLDPATGRSVRRVALPEGIEGSWSNMRSWGDYLVGQVGRHLVCMDRHADALLWKFECGHAALSVAAGGDRVFCAELADKRRGPDQVAKTRAFDIKNGKVLWEIDGNSPIRYSESLDLVVTSRQILQGKDGSLVAGLPGPPAPGTPPAAVPKPLFVIGPKVLWGTLESFRALDLPSGKPTGDLVRWTRRGCTSLRASTHLVTTRYKANVATIDLASHEITPFLNVRPACSNNLFPANGVLNIPSLTGGCTCNYSPVAQGFVPTSTIERVSAKP